MNPTELIGLVAAALTTLAFLPQVLKTWRKKSAGDLSLVTFSAFCAGVSLWLVYGFLVGDVPIIVANSITLPLALSILILTLRYRTQDAAAGSSEASRERYS